MKLISTILIFNKSLSPNLHGCEVFRGRSEGMYLISAVEAYNLYEVFKSPQN